MLAAVLAFLPIAPGAVGVADGGTYRTNIGDRGPADISENVRIIPPPTGGDLKVNIRADRPRYHVGDKLTAFFGVNRDSYVYIFNTDAAGITRQVFPNYFDTQNFCSAGKRYYIPDRSYDLEIAGPSGRETLTIVAVAQDFPFLREFRRYTRRDPYPASREGATALVRRIESFRTEPSAMSIKVVRPAPRENLWAEDSTTFYVMGSERIPAPKYKVPRYARMEIDSYPNNARIFIDTEYYGRTPQVLDRLETGYHRIRLEKEGYLPYDANLFLKANEMKHLDIFLHETPVEPGYSRSGKESAGDGFGFFFHCE
jgi:hypothetical protein